MKTNKHQAPALFLQTLLISLLLLFLLSWSASYLPEKAAEKRAKTVKNIEARGFLLGTLDGKLHQVKQ